MELFEKLKTARDPIVLYGMGDGADKLLDALGEAGIPVSGVFASDGFVRGQSFRGYKVESYGALKERYGKMTVLVAFASGLEEVIANVGRIAHEQELYIPDLPVVGGPRFDGAFYETHRAEFEEARALFADEESKTLFDEMIEYKLTGLPEPLMRHTVGHGEMFSFFSPASYRTALDLGAYVGDTAKELLSLAPSLSRLLCFEPDPRTYKKLCALAEAYPAIEPYPYGAWDRRSEEDFTAAGGRGARRGGGAKSVKVVFEAPDAVLGGERVDYIKFDVEGAEAQALKGCAETIGKWTPDILLSLYHRNEDLYSLPLLLRSLNPSYSFYLRRERCFPAWDLNLLAAGRK